MFSISMYSTRMVGMYRREASPLPTWLKVGRPQEPGRPSPVKTGDESPPRQRSTAPSAVAMALIHGNPYTRMDSDFVAERLLPRQSLPRQGADQALLRIAAAAVFVLVMLYAYFMCNYDIPSAHFRRP